MWDLYGGTHGVADNYDLGFRRFLVKQKSGLSRDLNPGPPAPKAGIIPLDHWADVRRCSSFASNCVPVPTGEDLYIMENRFVST